VRAQLTRLRTLHLVCTQMTLDLHGLMGMKAHELILSNRPYAIDKLEHMLEDATSVWPATLVIALFPKLYKVPGQKRLPSPPLIFDKDSGSSLIDKQTAILDDPLRSSVYLSLRMPDLLGVMINYRTNIPLRIHRHIERWIGAASLLPPTVTFVKVLAEMRCSAVSTDLPDPDPSVYLMQYRDIMELIFTLRREYSITVQGANAGAAGGNSSEGTRNKKRGHEHPSTSEHKPNKRKRGLDINSDKRQANNTPARMHRARKVVLVGNQPHVELQFVGSHLSDESLTQRVKYHLALYTFF